MIHTKTTKIGLKMIYSNEELVLLLRGQAK